MSYFTLAAKSKRLEAAQGRNHLLAEQPDRAHERVLGQVGVHQGHLRGALNVGASADEVDEAMALAAQVHPRETVAAALRLWVGVRTRWLRQSQVEDGA